MAESCLARGLSFDVGLMQINSYWIRRYRIPLRRLFHPRDNIYVACFILAESMRRDGDLKSCRALPLAYAMAP